MERRLAAILAADVVGYSKLMAADQAGTLAALRAHRESLFNPEIEKRGGRIVKLMGDGTLVEFPSMVEAVEAAIAIQKRLADSAGPPTWGGKRGNPVLLARRYFAEVQAIFGDVGARALICEYPEAVAEVAMDDLASGGGVLEDIDTPKDLRGLASNEKRARDE